MVKPLITIIKKNEAELGLIGDVQLTLKEVVESGNSGFLEGLHGTGTVEDIGEVGHGRFDLGFGIWDFRFQMPGFGVLLFALYSLLSAFSL
jgi:hypothetical protein